MLYLFAFVGFAATVGLATIGLAVIVNALNAKAIRDEQLAEMAEDMR